MKIDEIKNMIGNIIKYMPNATKQTINENLMTEIKINNNNIFYNNNVRHGNDDPIDEEDVMKIIANGNLFNLDGNIDKFNLAYVYSELCRLERKGYDNLNIFDFYMHVNEEAPIDYIVEINGEYIEARTAGRLAIK